MNNPMGTIKRVRADKARDMMQLETIAGELIEIKSVDDIARATDKQEWDAVWTAITTPDTWIEVQR